MLSIVVMFVMFFALVVSIIYIYFYALKQSSNLGQKRYSKVLELSKQYKLPKYAKQSSYKSYDYWNDAGDGSGVNYVQMPDGSVRID